MNWLKQWGKTLGLVLGAIVLALAAGRAASLKSSARRKEDAATHKLNSGISKELAAGKKLTESANKDKDKAVIAHAKMQAQLEKLGEANEDLDTIADRFNSRRVRHDENG